MLTYGLICTAGLIHPTMAAAVISFAGSTESLYCNTVVSASEKYALRNPCHGPLEFWDMSEKVLIRTMPSGASLNGTIALSRDEKILALGTLDGSVELFNFPSLRSLTDFKGPSGPTFLSIASDGSSLVIASRHGHLEAINFRTHQRIWSLDLPRANPTSSGTPEIITTINPKSGQDVFVITNDDTLRVIDRGTGRILFSKLLSEDIFKRCAKADIDDEERMLVIGCSDGVAKIFHYPDDLFSNKFDTVYNSTKEIGAIKVINDDRFVLVGLDGQLTTWSRARAPEGTPSRLWTRSEPYSLGRESWSYEISIFGGSKYVIPSGWGAKSAVYDLESGVIVDALGDNLSPRIDLTQNNVHDQSVRVNWTLNKFKSQAFWDLKSGKLVIREDLSEQRSGTDSEKQRIQQSVTNMQGNQIEEMACPTEVAPYRITRSPRGRYTAWFDQESGVISLKDTETCGKPIELPGIKGVGEFSFSMDEELVAFSSNTGELGIWSTRDDLLKQKFSTKDFGANPGAAAGSLAFSDDKSLLAVQAPQIDLSLLHGVAPENTIFVLNISSRRVVNKLPADERVFRFAFSPNNDNLLTSQIGGITSWNLSTFLSAGTKWNASGEASIPIFTADRDIVASGGNALRLWDAKTGRLLMTSRLFYPKGQLEWVTITPEGFFDASANGAKYLNVVQGLDVYSIDQAYQSLYRPDLVREKLAGDPDGKVRDAAAKLDLDKVIGSGKAPAARFTSPEARATVSGTEVAAEVELTDAGGGVGKVEWRVNGTTLGVDDGGLVRQAGGAGRTVRLRRTLPLGPGDAAVEVVAYNAGNLLASDPVRLYLTRPAVPAVVEAAPRLFVLAAGINDYWDGRLRLRYAVPDAKALSEGLRQAGQGLYADVAVTTLLDADVTAAKLDQAFADLGRRMRPSDVFIFFIAGHGKTVDGHYHFIPWDFRYENAASIAQNGIDQSRFQAWLARVPARKSLLLTDTCESGSLTEDQQVASARGLDLVAAQQAATELLTRAVGRTVLAASTDDAPALEGYHGHGVFSYAVLDALSHAAAGSDGLITVTELAGYVDRRVPELSYAAFHQRQIPQMRIVGSNFPILTRIAAVPEAGGDDVVPDRPTHVVTAPVPVRKGADAASDVVVSLQPGSQVAVVRSADGWTLVARDGQKLGYVEDKNLARLQ